jgi:mercuric ion binding protein
MVLLKEFGMKNVFAIVAMVVSIGSAWAAPATVTLSVPSMDCPVCPITVKKALMGLAGVHKAAVDFEHRQAIVTFDDSKTSVDDLTRATRNAGYPSKRATKVAQ